MVEKWRKTLDEGGEIRAVFTDLSAYDCIDHNLLLSRPNAYGSQSTFTCSKLTIETLEQCVKYVPSWQKLNFEHIIAGWDLKNNW